MIRRSFITAVCFFTIYSIFLIICKTKWAPNQYMYQGNIIKADRYLYNDSPLKAIIIGTSLSSRLLSDSLKAYNLGMPGLGPFDGLDILLKKKDLPKVVFIEINYFYKPESKEFINSFDSKEVIFLKSKLPALRDENQPVAISFDILQKTVSNIIFSIRPKKNQVLNNYSIDTSLFKIFAKEYTTPDTKLVNASAEKLKKYIIEINQRDSKVWLFEMPTNPKFMASPLTKIVRTTILREFPQCIFIPVQNRQFTTSDGIHLGEKEALDYTIYLKGKLLSIGY